MCSDMFVVFGFLGESPRDFCAFGTALQNVSRDAQKEPTKTPTEPGPSQRTDPRRRVVFARHGGHGEGPEVPGAGSKARGGWRCFLKKIPRPPGRYVL